MNSVSFLVILSSLMMPLNLLCTAWILGEMFDLSNTTFLKMQNALNSRHMGASLNRKMNSYIVLNYLLDKSCNPDRTRALYRFYLTALVPGALSFVFTPFMSFTYSSDTVDIYIAVIAVSFVVNIGLALYKKVYFKMYIDDEINYSASRKKKRRKKQSDEAKEIKTVISYFVIGIIFFLVYVGFNLAFSGAMQRQGESANQTVTTQIDYHYISDVLVENGYETNEVPVTFWYIDSVNLTYVKAGIKDGTKIEFYDYTPYSSSDTGKKAYQEICGIICGDTKPKTETKLPDTGEMTIVSSGGMKEYILYKNNTVIYAYTPNGDTKVDEFLAEVGYTAKP